MLVQIVGNDIKRGIFEKVKFFFRIVIKDRVT
jgi:hypothetical protein